MNERKHVRLSTMDPTIKLKEEITLKKYCECHNITKNTAYRMIKNGDLHAYKNDKGRWMIPIL